MKQIAIAGLALGLVAAISGCASGTPQAVTQHSNTFNITLGSGVTSLSFEPNNSAYSVTSGQPWGGVTGCSVTSGTCVITVLAGRSKSSAVAQWFGSQNFPAMCVFGCSGISNLAVPSELNFAFNGSLVVNGVGNGVTIGQGSDGAGANNWWIANSAAVSCNAQSDLFINDLWSASQNAAYMNESTDDSMKIAATSTC